MKVFIVCKEPFPFGMAATKRIQCYAKALIAGGISCEVLVFSRHERGFRRLNSTAKGKFEGIQFRYMGGSTRKPFFKIPRIIAEKSDFLFLERYLNRNLDKGDVVLGYFFSDPSHTDKIVEITHKRKASFVRELCEIPYYGDESEAAKAGFKELTETVFPKYDGIIAISDALVDFAKKYVSKSARIIKIPILVDFDRYNLPDRSTEAETPFIFHSGTLYEQKDGILGAVEAFALARGRLDFPVKYIIAGNLDNSPQKNELMELVSKYHLEESVVFTGYLRQKESNEFLEKASFVVINKHANVQNLHGFSTKLGEYLAAGKCVLITNVGEAMNWLKDGENARIVPKDEVRILADGMVELFSERQKARELGENGRALCRDNFDWRDVSDKLCEFVKSFQFNF